MKSLCSVLFLVLLLPTPSLGQNRSFQSKLYEAQEGDVGAQSDIGLAYLFGEGVKPNRRQAAFWLGKVANQGYPLGACNFGHYYGRGRRAQRNNVLMVKWAYIGEILDPLRCEAGVHIMIYKPSECHIARGLELAVAWLRAHPEYKNNFGEQPWLSDDPKKFEDKRKKKCR